MVSIGTRLGHRTAQTGPILHRPRAYQLSHPEVVLHALPLVAAQANRTGKRKEQRQSDLISAPRDGEPASRKSTADLGLDRPCGVEGGVYWQIPKCDLTKEVVGTCIFQLV